MYAMENGASRKDSNFIPFDELIVLLICYFWCSSAAGLNDIFRVKYPDLHQ